MMDDEPRRIPARLTAAAAAWPRNLPVTPLPLPTRPQPNLPTGPLRDQVAVKYKKKIELMVRKPDKDPEEVEEPLAECPFCNMPGPETELQCVSCQNLIPFDVSTGAAGRGMGAGGQARRAGVSAACERGRLGGGDEVQMGRSIEGRGAPWPCRQCFSQRMHPTPANLSLEGAAPHSLHASAKAVAPFLNRPPG